MSNKPVKQMMPMQNSSPHKSSPAAPEIEKQITKGEFFLVLEQASMKAISSHHKSISSPFQVSHISHRGADKETQDLNPPPTHPFVPASQPKLSAPASQFIPFIPSFHSVPRAPFHRTSAHQQCSPWCGAPSQSPRRRREPQAGERRR